MVANDDVVEARRVGGGVGEQAQQTAAAQYNVAKWTILTDDMPQARGWRVQRLLLASAIYFLVFVAPLAISPGHRLRHAPLSETAYGLG